MTATSEPLVQNRTVSEMDRQKPEEHKVYRLTFGHSVILTEAYFKHKTDLRLLRLSPEAVETLRAAQDKGGLWGKVARHMVKWAARDGDTTTIPLADAEHAELKKLGVDLSLQQKVQA